MCSLWSMLPRRKSRKPSRADRQKECDGRQRILPSYKPYLFLMETLEARIAAGSVLPFLSGLTTAPFADYTQTAILGDMNAGTHHVAHNHDQSRVELSSHSSHAHPSPTHEHDEHQAPAGSSRHANGSEQYQTHTD